MATNKTKVEKSKNEKASLSKVGKATRASANNAKKKTTQQRTRLAKEAMLQALSKNLGIVTTSAKQVGISRETHRQWLIKDEDYRKKVDDIDAEALDFAESKLFQVMSGNFYIEKISGGDKRTIAKATPDTRAIMFYLETKGKIRGFTKRQELTGAEGTPLEAGSGSVVVLPSNGRESSYDIEQQYIEYLESGGKPYPNIPLPDEYKQKKEKGNVVASSKVKKAVIILPKVKK